MVATRVAVWDEGLLLGQVLDTIATSPRVPLADVPEIRDPGCYLLSGRISAFPFAGTIVGDGRYPLLVGKARNLEERMKHYRETFASIPELDPRRVRVTVLVTDTAEAATGLEALLIRALAPPLNKALSGAGSRRAGTKREREQARTSFGTLWPRPWEEGLPSRDVEDVRLRLQGHLLRLEDEPPLWRALRA